MNASDLTTFGCRSMRPRIGGEITALHPRDIDDRLFPEILEKFLEHKVLVFRDVDVSRAEQVAFARRFGEVQVHVMNQYHDNAFPELYELSNLDRDGNPSGKHPDQGTLVWHTDGSWMRRTGLATFMFAQEVPPEGQGGETHFCETYGAWDRLTEEKQAMLSKLRAVHNLDFSRNRRHGHEPMSDAQRAAMPPVDHPIRRRHPDTGRDTIFLGDHAEYIQGMDYDVGRALIDSLNTDIIHEDSVYRHHWRDRDFVIWDNRAVLHRATEYDTAEHRRVIRRCTVIGDVPCQ